jgi:hypothetical protein
MIYLEPPYIIVDGLMILRDHADPLQYYYYPLAPRLALQPDGAPAFLFLKYREDLTSLPEGAEPGGGFLSFDVDLRVDEETLASARRRIRRDMNLDQDPRLAPIDYRAGKLRLLFLDFEEPPDEPEDEPRRRPDEEPQPRFVEQASYSATPALYGDNRAAFSVQLSARGATLVQETLDARSSLIGVVYDLTFVALRPAYDIRLFVDWDRVYEHFDENYQANALIFSVDISNAVDELIEDRAIVIDVISFGAGVNDRDILAQKDEAKQFVLDMITDELFTPSLNPEEAVGATWYHELSQAARSVRPTNFGYTRRNFTRTDQRTLTVNMRERSATERRIAPQGHLQGLLGTLQDFPLEDFVREIDLRDPFFQRVRVEVTGGAAMKTDKVDAVHVHLEYGPDGRAEASDVLIREAGKTEAVAWVLDEQAGLNYRYHFRVHFDPEAPPGAADMLVSPEYVTNATKLLIDPRKLYAMRKAEVQASGVDWTRYDQIEVNLRYSDAAAALELTETVLLQHDKLKQDWQWRTRPDAPAAFDYRVTFYPKVREPIRRDWQSSIDPAVIVGDALTEVMEVTVSSAGDFNLIRRIMVELRYSDPANNVREQKLLTFNGDEMQTWQVQLADPTLRRYTYRVIVQYQDNTIKQLPTVETDEMLIFVGDVFEQARTVTISAAGRPFNRASLSKVRVQLRYEDPANEVLETHETVLTSLDDSDEWRFNVKDPEIDRYTYEVHFIETTGFVTRQAPAQSSTDQLVIPIE